MVILLNVYHCDDLKYDQISHLQSFILNLYILWEEVLAIKP